MSQEKERFQRLSRLFEEARRHRGQARDDLVEKACAGDVELRKELQALLAAHEDSEDAPSDRLLDAGRGLRSALLVGEEPTLPAELGRFKVIEEVARGGIGVVLRVRDGEIGRDVAIKLLRREHARDPRLARRLLAEGRIGGRLQHPSIVPVHELGLAGGETPYFAMKLVEGETLAKILKARESTTVDRARLLQIFQKVCEAMAYAHARGVIHRDLKPANIMIGAFGEVQVMDWGLAKMLRVTGAEGAAGVGAPGRTATREPAPGMEAPRAGTRSADPVDSNDSKGQLTSLDPRASDANAAEELSIAGSVMGTPAYMPPEQAQGILEDLDERVDVFSLGAILCEIVTLAPPYGGKTTQEVLSKAQAGQVEDALRRLEQADLEPQLLELARSCLAPPKADRPRDAGVVASALGAFLRSVEERARAAELEAAEAKVKVAGERKARRLTLVAAALVLLVLLVSGAAYLVVADARQERELASVRRFDRAFEAAREQRAAAQKEGSSLPLWEAALTAARSAEALAAELAAEERSAEARALAAEVEGRRDVEAFLAEAEQIQASLLSASYSRRDPRRQAVYADFFRRRLSLDIEPLDVAAAAEALRALGPPESIAPILDEWARVKEEARRPYNEGWTKLVDVARELDGDPLRRSLRSTLLAADGGKSLEALVDRLDPAALEPQSLLLTSRVLAQLGRQDKAAELLRRGQLIHPGDLWINLYLGSSLSAPGRSKPADGIPFLMAALALKPASVLAHQLLAIAYRDSGQLEEAIATLQRSIEVAPEDPGLLLALGKTYEIAEDLQGAQRIYQQVLEVSRADPLVHSTAIHNLGILSSRRGDSEGAIARYRQAIEEAPSAWGHYNALAYALVESGKLREGIEYYRRSLAKDPEDPMVLTNYANACLMQHDLAAARKALEAAVSLDPGYALAFRLLGTVLEKQGALDDALETFATAVRLEPADSYAYAHGIRILLEEGASLQEASIKKWLTHLGELILSASGPRNVYCLRAFAAAWILAPEPARASMALQAAESDVERTRRREPGGLWVLARILEITGKRQEAVGILEEASYLPEGPIPRVAESLDALRRSVLPDLWTHGAVDALLADVHDPAGARALRERYAGLLDGGEGTASTAVRRYLDARLLALEGASQEALQKLEDVIALDRSRPEPYLAMTDLLATMARPEETRARLLEVFSKGAPPRPLPRASRAPEILEPAKGAFVSPEAATLRASAFLPTDPRVELRAVRWRLWDAPQDPRRAPVLDVVRAERQPDLRVPAGLLLSDRRYLCEVWHRGNDGRWSPASPPRSFSTTRSRLEARRFTLDGAWRADVVRDPDDDANDSMDQDGYLLAVDGYDGVVTDNPGAQGLPRDRTVSVHILAPYDGPNAILLPGLEPIGASAPGERSAPIRIAAPPGRYACVRLLVAGTNGASAIRVGLFYKDGSHSDGVVPCLDWFDDLADRPWTGDLERLTCPLRGMDRFRGEVFEERNEAALFDALIPTDETRELAALTLEVPPGAGTPGRTRAYVFAITGMGVREE